MANGQDHRIIGGIAGFGAGLACAGEEATLHRFLEAAGGLAGGVLGAKLPDWLDPPTSPNHRSIGHGVIPIAAIASWYLPNLSDWQMKCRSLAARNAWLSQQSQSEWERAWYLLLEAFFRLLAGVLAGLPAGYLSHLGLDACTPKGLPVVC